MLTHSVSVRARTVQQRGEKREKRSDIQRFLSWQLETMIGLARTLSILVPLVCVSSLLTLDLFLIKLSAAFESTRVNCAITTKFDIRLR